MSRSPVRASLGAGKSPLSDAPTPSHRRIAARRRGGDRGAAAGARSPGAPRPRQSRHLPSPCSRARRRGAGIAGRALAGNTVDTLSAAWGDVPGGGVRAAPRPARRALPAPRLRARCRRRNLRARLLRRVPTARQPAGSWASFALLIASMALVVTARNGVLFLVAWEGMALSSFFLVMFHHERAEVPRAGWMYLVATHLGTAFLLVLFACSARDAGSSILHAAGAAGSGAIWRVFVLALIGFGAKAGLRPLPRLASRGPSRRASHVSALLSGSWSSSASTGSCECWRSRSADPAWGAAAPGRRAGLRALRGRLRARAARSEAVPGLQQGREPRHIVGVGIGLGRASPPARLRCAVLGFAGGLLHVWNHALFKGLLFLAAGSVARDAARSTWTSLGGLLRRMPWTGAGSPRRGAAAMRPAAVQRLRRASS